MSFHTNTINISLPCATNHDELLSNLKQYFPDIAYTKYRPTDYAFDIISTTQYNAKDLEMKIQQIIAPYSLQIDGNSAPRTVDEAWIVLRRERNKRLMACDWTQLSDSPLSDTEKLIWRLYRQALRDMPLDCVNPFEPNWPTTPQPIVMP